MWKLVVVNLGGGKFSLAEKRIRDQASQYSDMLELLVIDESNLGEYAPITHQKFKEYLNIETPGYGYWTWKSEICLNVMKNLKESDNGIIYLDIGCEIFYSKFARLLLRYHLRAYRRKTVVFTKASGSEFNYTKKAVINRFNLSKADLNSSQYAATWFIADRAALGILDTWHKITIENIEFSNNETSDLGNEDSQFISHRADQSILSLLLKSLSIKPSRLVLYSGVNNRLHRTRRHFYPFWTSRNLG
jgi:hypothetical protein